MIVYKDHNGVTTFNEAVKLFSYVQLVEAFGSKHDCKKLAKSLGIRVEKLGEAKPLNLDSENSFKSKKKKKED